MFDLLQYGKLGIQKFIFNMNNFKLTWNLGCICYYRVERIYIVKNDASNRYFKRIKIELFFYCHYNS